MNATISMTNKLRGTVSMANSKINGGASPYPKGASGDIITITDGVENTPLKSAIVNIEPVQSGSDDPSPTNIRPISGWTGCNVTRSGFNQWDEEWEVGDISQSATLLRYWQCQERAHYPHARENVEYFTELLAEGGEAIVNQ